MAGSLPLPAVGPLLTCDFSLFCTEMPVELGVISGASGTSGKQKSPHMDSDR